MFPRVQVSREQPTLRTLGLKLITSCLDSMRSMPPGALQDTYQRTAPSIIQASTAPASCCCRLGCPGHALTPPWGEGLGRREEEGKACERRHSTGDCTQLNSTQSPASLACSALITRLPSPCPALPLPQAVGEGLSAFPLTPAVRIGLLEIACCGTPWAQVGTAGPAGQHAIVAALASRHARRSSGCPLCSP